MHIPCYNLYRRDLDLQVGGVYLYVHSDIHSVTVPVADSGVECWLSVYVLAPKATEFVVCSVYRSPSTAVHFWDLYSQHLEAVTSSDCRLIVLGDFNTDVLHPTPTSNHNYKHLLNLCAGPSLEMNIA